MATKTHPLQALKQRRAEKTKELQNLIATLVRDNDLSETAIFNKVAFELDLSPQTVRNYREGHGGDGFMLETIIDECRKFI